MEFYPPNAPVPQERRTDRLYLRPLRATDVEIDYDAVMSSAAMLRAWSQSDWPADDFTLAENLADLVRHEREHLARQAFTYTVLDPSGARCLGCVYIVPLRPDEVALCPDAAYAADVGFWVRASEVPHALDEHLLETLQEWFREEWALDRVLFTVAERESRQAGLLAAAGLPRLAPCTLDRGVRCWVYGRPGSRPRVSLGESMAEFRKQIQQGIVQQAYRGLLEYMLGLRTYFAGIFPGGAVAGSVYHGYMDMTYFALFPEALRQRKLKVAVVFVYDTFRFEVWLSAANKQVQARYWTLFRESKWDRYRVVPALEGADSILEHILVDDPDWDDPDGLTRQIEAATRHFVGEVEDFLSTH